MIGRQIRYVCTWRGMCPWLQGKFLWTKFLQTKAQVCEWTVTRSRCMERLQKLHNMGMRTLLQAYPRTPQSILDAKLHWFTLQQQSKLQRLTVVDMQMCTWGAPDYLKNLLTPKQSSIVTRSRFKLTLKAPKTCIILA